MVNFILGTAVIAAIYGIMSVSLHLQAGVSGLFNFGVAAFFGIGAYATGIGSLHGLGWPFAILIGIIVASLAGAGIGYLGRTLKTVYWAIATLAFAQLLWILSLNLDFITRGGRGISSIVPFFSSLDPRNYNLAWLCATGSVLFICIIISWVLTRGQFGRILRLLKENESLAASLGHDVIWAKVRVMAISAPMAAIAGSLYTHYITYIGPEQLQAFTTFIVFTMIVVGGMGNLAGAIIGTILIQALYAATRIVGEIIGFPPVLAGGARILIVGAVLLGFLLFRPGGLFPERLRRLSVTNIK